MFLQILLSALCLQVVSSNSPNPATDLDNSSPSFAIHNERYKIDWRLLKKFASVKNKNVIISPISLKLILAVLYDGSAGLTEKEFQRVLDFPVDKNKLRQDLSNLLDTLVVQRDRYIINIGSQLFLDSQLEALANYAGNIFHYYHAEITKTNFSNPNDASKDINNWVADITNNKIKTLVSPDDIDNVILLAANAIFFRGLWTYPFPRNESFDGDFYVSKNEVVKAKYMKQSNEFFYSESKELGAQILRIPYKGEKFGLYIILPYSKDNLSEFLENLNLDTLSLNLRFIMKHTLTLILPKFGFSFQTKYGEILRQFGFENLFHGRGNFPEIVKGPQLIVSDILQKSGIEVNEEGSITYAATQVQLQNKFAEVPTTYFNATRPFIFFIEEETTKNILFMGKVERPEDLDHAETPPRFGSDANKPAYVPQTQPSQFPISGQYNPNQPPVTLKLGSKFDIKLLKSALSTSKNVLLSPASIKISLAMLGEAAVGSTAKEIYDLLEISNYPEYRKQLFNSLVTELNNSKTDSVLEFQNALFVSSQHKVKEEYQNTVQKYYGAIVKQLNYLYKEQAASDINAFIRNATHGFIPSVISPDDINYNTEIILTNVLYFKAQWLKTFEKSLTKTSYFYSSTGSYVNTPFMQIIDMFYYRELSNAYVIKLDYTGSQRAMLLVIPKQQDGLLLAIKELELQGFESLLGSLKDTEVELFLPKFEINFKLNLVNLLRKMGVRQVFDSNSNLANLLEGGTQGMVDSFIHKTKIEVTEDGTEASAVSLVSVIPLMGTTSPKIRADHPFAFFIYNTQTNTILFEGILNEPENKVVADVKTGTPRTSSDAVRNQQSNTYLSQQLEQQQPIFINNY